MTEPTDSTEPTLPTLAEQAAQLAANVKNLGEGVEALAASQRWMKIAVVAFGVVLAVMFALGVVVGFVAVEARQASDSSARNAETQRLTCEFGNEARAGQRELWGYVLTIANNPTPEQKQKIALFRTYIGQLFAPRDCSGPVPTGVPTPPPTR